jgi:hypothetical protein
MFSAKHIVSANCNVEDTAYYSAKNVIFSPNWHVKHKVQYSEHNGEMKRKY